MTRVIYMRWLFWGHSLLPDLHRAVSLDLRPLHTTKKEGVNLFREVKQANYDLPCASIKSDMLNSSEDLLLYREISVVHPFQFRSKTPSLPLPRPYVTHPATRHAFRRDIIYDILNTYMYGLSRHMDIC